MALERDKAWPLRAQIPNPRRAIGRRRDDMSAFVVERCRDDPSLMPLKSYEARWLMSQIPYPTLRS